MTTGMPTLDALAVAVEAAEAQALAAHESGACRESEWSCSHCEVTP